LNPHPPEPYFHGDSAALRFWVAAPDGAGWVGAIVRPALLHHRFQGDMGGSDALAVYQKHRPEIDAAVLRRIALGSIEPVMLREADFDTGGTARR
jgi:hypothetical protein